MPRRKWRPRKQTQLLSNKAAAVHDAAVAKKCDADNAVAKEKCDALTGEANSKCLAEAKAHYGKWLGLLLVATIDFI